MKFIELLESGSTFECEVFSDEHDESPYSFVWFPEMRVTQIGRLRWVDLLNCGAYLYQGDIWLEGLSDVAQYYDFLKTAAGGGPASEYDELFERVNERQPMKQKEEVKTHADRYAIALGLSPEVTQKSHEIIEQADEKNLLSGRKSESIAAAALYISALLYGEKRLQREVAEASGVSDVTIRNRYQELLELLELERPVRRRKWWEANQ